MVLVGFMGCGKTTVAPLVAGALGWSSIDFDEVIVDRTGKSIADLFEEYGEARFREIEAEVGSELLARDGVVLAPGGGWAVHAGRLEALPTGTASVWLRVAVDEAIRRVTSSGRLRPLLKTESPAETARALLAEREPHYARAQHEVDTTGLSPEDVTRRIVAILRPTHDLNPDS